MTELKPLDLDEFRIWMEKKQEEMYEKNGVIDIDELNEAIINEIKECIRTACKFYLKYEDKPELLIHDFPKFEAELREKFELRVPHYSWAYIEYNEWLFRLVFKDVLEGENDDNL